MSDGIKNSDGTPRDPLYSQNVCLHEAIHATLADLLGVDFEHVTARADGDSEGHLRLKNSTLRSPERHDLESQKALPENGYKLQPATGLLKRLRNEIIVSVGPSGWGEHGVECSGDDLEQARRNAYLIELCEHGGNARSTIKECVRTAAELLSLPHVRDRVKRLAKTLVTERTMTRTQIRALTVASEMERW